MMLEASKSYIQKNPLFGRKVIFFDRIRESIWDWQLCDATIVTIDKDPAIVHVRGVASSVYEHQGLEDMPVRVFRKIESLTKLYDAMARVADTQKAIVLRQETLAQLLHRKESFYYFYAVKNVNCYNSDCIFFNFTENEM